MTSRFKSGEEVYFNDHVEQILKTIPDLAMCHVIQATYEGISFQIPGGSYTPDFYVVMENGVFHFQLCVEVKGSRHQAGYRESKQRLNAVAALYPDFWYAQSFITLRVRKGMPVAYKSNLVSKPRFMHLAREFTEASCVVCGRPASVSYPFCPEHDLRK